MIGPCIVCVILGEVPVALSDLGADRISPAAVNKLFKSEPHRFGTARDNPSFDQLINSRRKPVLYSGH